MINNFDEIPKKIETQNLKEYTELLTDWYISRTTPEYRKNRGQFFTPKSISEFMVRQCIGIEEKENIRVLDPGAGIGIFESSICEFLLLKKKKSKILFDLYESDENILPLLKYNMEVCKESMSKEGFEMLYCIHDKDFILSNSSVFNDESNDFDVKKNGYDFVISNPPYYKLKKESKQSIAMSSIIKGQPNIYALFMALSAKLLKDGSQMAVLTPRSYCSGLYFRTFRKWFFKNVKPIKIHVFESRNKVFKRYNVLQEILILTAVKSSNAPKNIMVSTSNGELNEKDTPIVRKTEYKKIIIENNNDIIMRIPTSKFDESIATNIDKLGFKLGTLGLKVSTGRVVPFRTTEYILKNINAKLDYSPMIWMQNIINGRVIWPTKENNKPPALKNKTESNRLLIPNGNYVLIKRFSTKEGKQRLNAGVLLEKFLNADHIGIENHVNYIYKIEGKLIEDEVYGITALLNSRLYNRYLHIINGSTQVNASEINDIPLPSLKKIRLIGSLVRKEKENNEIKNEKIIAKELNIYKKIISDLIK